MAKEPLKKEHFEILQEIKGNLRLILKSYSILNKKIEEVKKGVSEVAIKLNGFFHLPVQLVPV